MGKTNVKLRRLLQLAALFALAGQAASAAETALAELVDPAGEPVGEAVFRQAPRGVVLTVRASGLAPGPHGIHLHAKGSCEPDFAAAGGHINPQGAAHGLFNADGPDSGDLPNLHVAADGSARAEFYTMRVRIGDEDNQAGASAAPVLLDDDGSAVIIHASPDDHQTQPIGGAGGRIACGVVRKSSS